MPLPAPQCSSVSQCDITTTLLLREVLISNPSILEKLLTQALINPITSKTQSSSSAERFPAEPQTERTSNRARHIRTSGNSSVLAWQTLPLHYTGHVTALTAGCNLHAQLQVTKEHVPDRFSAGLVFLGMHTKVSGSVILVDVCLAFVSFREQSSQS